MKKYIPKHGDWITCEINGVKIKNARVSEDQYKDRCGNYKLWICHNSRLRQGSIAENRLGFNYSYFLGITNGLGVLLNSDITNLKPAPPRKTKAEKVREARAKKKGKLPDTWRQVIDGMFRIEPTPNPYKELVEKVKEKCKGGISAWEQLIDGSECGFSRIAEAAMSEDKIILRFIDQEEKKINKTSYGTLYN